MGRPAARRASAPIDLREIQREYHGVRVVVALAVVAFGLVGLANGVAGWPYFVLPAAATGAHAASRLARPGGRPLTSLLADVTMFSFVALALGNVPHAEFAAIAYVAAAALLLLPARETLALGAYATAWGVVVVALAPLSDIRAIIGLEEAGFDRAVALLLLLMLAGLLVTATRALHGLRRRQEEALVAERRASRLKDEFVSMVSHEFRTPLTSIAGFVETLQEGWAGLSQADIDEFLSIIHTEAVHLSHLVEDILVIPRLEAGRLPFHPETFELAPVVRHVRDLVFADGTHEAEVAIPGGVFVHADPRRLAQVLRNLMENARKYGGDQVLVEGEHRGGHYQIVVADNGPGIPAAARDQVFQLFEQVTKGDDRTDRGVGLGLPIASRLVGAMGGSLWYEARFPTGSRFCFTLPAAARTAAESAPPLPAPWVLDAATG